MTGKRLPVRSRSRRPFEAMAESGAIEPVAGNHHISRWEVAGVQRFDEVLAGAKLDGPGTQKSADARVHMSTKCA
jgi:hypothetical protein